MTIKSAYHERFGSSVFLTRLESHAQIYLDRPKIFYLNEEGEIASQISYQDLIEEAKKLAEQLKQLGVKDET